MKHSTELIHEIKRLFHEGYGERRISKSLNISRGSVGSLIKKLNLSTKDRQGKKGKDKQDVSNGKFCKDCESLKDISLFRLIKSKCRQWYRAICIECEKQYNKQKHTATQPKVKRKKYKRTNKIKKNNIINKLRKSISSSINKQLKLTLNKKNDSCFKHLNYTIQELKLHIESLFEPWMNWNNRGIYSPSYWDDNDSSTWNWQLDHIIPHSKFIYTSMDQQLFKDCWALSNLRPLSAKQNVYDGGTRIRHKII